MIVVKCSNMTLKNQLTFLQALERELAPVEERLSKLDAMAQKVVAGNPQESRQVQGKEAEITDLWKKLKTKAANRKAQLDNAFLLQTFLADSRDLVSHTVMIMI